MTSVKPKQKRRTYGGLSPEQRQQQRREQLIRAGLEAFGTRGYHAVTVREICAEAELTERYFYESFPSLEKLFAAVYAAVSVELRQATLAVLGKPFEAPLELAEAALRAFFEFVKNDPRRARILLVEAIAVGEPMQRFVYQNTRDYAELLRSFIELLTPEATSAGLDPELLSTGLIGANIYIAAQWFREGFRAPLEKVLHNTMALYRAMDQSFRPSTNARTASGGRRNPGGKR